MAEERAKRVALATVAQAVHLAAEKADLCEGGFETLAARTANPVLAAYAEGMRGDLERLARFVSHIQAMASE